jgi:PAS domain S-box-containing protein
MLASEDRGLIYVNHHYEAFTGIAPADLARRWREPIHPDDLDAIDTARATGQSYEVEYRLRRASDGAYRWHFARCLRVAEQQSSAYWLALAVDIDDRKRAEESLRFIERAGALLSQTLDLQATFETLLDLVVPDVGDWASITLRDEDGRIRTVVGRHKDPAKQHLFDTIVGEDCFIASASWGTPQVYQSGRAQLQSNVTVEDVSSAVKPRYRSTFATLGFGSLVSLPISFGGDVIGSFGIVSVGERRQYTEADLRPLEELARRAGFAIGNARLYGRERRVSQQFQDAAMPRALPTVDGLTFDGYYLAGRAEALVGGDWYDAFVIADGRVVVSVGDVAGSGLNAAVQMSHVRQLIRGAAHIDPDPTLILDVADRALRSEFDQCVVTAFVGVIDTRQRTMVFSSAGHVPVLLRESDGTIEQLKTPGVPIGLRDMAPSENRTVALPDGSCLLLYTDGLVEWSRDLIHGEQLLRERFSQAPLGGRERRAETLVRGILANADTGDDVAALIVAFDFQRPRLAR